MKYDTKIAEIASNFIIFVHFLFKNFQNRFEIVDKFCGKITSTGYNKNVADENRKIAKVKKNVNILSFHAKIYDVSAFSYTFSFKFCKFFQNIFVIY